MSRHSKSRSVLRMVSFLILSTILLQSRPALARPDCGDCDQGVVVNSPDCPWDSECAGCWKTCIVGSCVDDGSCGQCTAWEMTCDQRNYPDSCSTTILYDGPC
jgi:hypothetical protein